MKVCYLSGLLTKSLPLYDKHMLMEPKPSTQTRGYSGGKATDCLSKIKAFLVASPCGVNIVNTTGCVYSACGGHLKAALSCGFSDSLATRASDFPSPL